MKTLFLLHLMQFLRSARRFLPASAAVLLLVAPAPGAIGAEKPLDKPAPAVEPAPAPPPAAPAPEHVQVEGFRSAHWGMSEAQVKTAIHKDFNIPADKIEAEQNPSERTTVLICTVNDLLEGAGKARVSYIFGYSTKKLIQANLVWGTSVDPAAKPENIVAAANQLRTLFLTSGYDPNTVASNVATGGGTILVFQGQDSDKHMTLLRLLSAAAPASSRQKGKAEPTSPTVVLQLSYVQDAQNPDVYRLKKGQF